MEYLDFSMHEILKNNEMIFNWGYYLEYYPQSNPDPNPKVKISKNSRLEFCRLKKF